MKKKLLLILCGTLCILSLCGCGNSNKKTYNSTISSEDRSNSKDSRVLIDGELPSNFELISCENVDKYLIIYIVKDRQSELEYIIVVNISNNYSANTISITPRLKHANK